MQVSRWIEPQDDSTCMVPLCHPRRVFCRIGRGVGEGVQSESRSTGDDRRSPGPTTESGTTPEGLGDVGRGERNHVTISFAGVHRRGI